MTELQQRLDDLSRAPVLLVASDFDGTLAPIVSEPSRAEANRESLVALRALAEMPQTHVAIISGRALPILRRKPWTSSAAPGRKPRQRIRSRNHHSADAGGQALLERIKKEVQDIAAAAPGPSWSSSRPGWPSITATSTSNSARRHGGGHSQRAGPGAREYSSDPAKGH